MNIEYLQLMKQTPRLKEWTNRGVKEEDIYAFEEKMDKKFPKAYREFLFLGGDGANMITADHGFYNPRDEDLFYMERIQLWVRNTLKEVNVNIEGGEFWAICHLDGGESFDFFYFNDTDAEDPENSPVYYFNGEDLEDGEKASFDNIKRWPIL